MDIQNSNLFSFAVIDGNRYVIYLMVGLRWHQFFFVWLRFFLGGVDENLCIEILDNFSRKPLSILKTIAEPMPDAPLSHCLSLCNQRQLNS